MKQTKPILKTDGKALLKAAKKGDDAAVKDCINSGIDIETKDKDGNTALHLASSKDHISTMKLLLDLGADIQATDNTGNTPLHKAVPQDRAIILLIQKSADINVKNASGDTPFDRLKGYVDRYLPVSFYELGEQHTKKLEEKVEQQDTLIQELQKEVKALCMQMQELTKQKALTSKDDDDSSSNQKGYSPSFNFQNTN